MLFIFTFCRSFFRASKVDCAKIYVVRNFNWADVKRWQFYCRGYRFLCFGCIYNCKLSFAIILMCIPLFSNPCGVASYVLIYVNMDVCWFDHNCFPIYVSVWLFSVNFVSTAKNKFVLLRCVNEIVMKHSCGIQ